MSKDSSDLLGWFGKRREGAVADGLRTMSIPVRDCVVELGAAMRAMRDGDVQAARKATDRIYICEHEADSIEDRLCNEISLGELSPQEREDFMHFIRKLDKVANWSKEAALALNLIEDVGLAVPADIWSMTAQAGADLESELRNLVNAIEMLATDGGDVGPCIQGVREMERTVDRAYYDITKAAYSSDMDVKAILMVTRIVDAVENAADTCKGCSDTVAVLHYAKRVRCRYSVPTGSAGSSTRT